MLKGFLFSGVIRGYVIVVGLALQFVMARTMGKEDFGSVNAFISTVILATFLLSAAPTRQLVRDLGAFGIKARGAMAERYINASHLFLILSTGLAGLTAILAQTWLASFFLVLGLVFTSSLYSAFFRGIGRYLVGNIEAGVIRITAFLVFLVLFYMLEGKLSSELAQMLYVAAAALGFVLLVILRGPIRRLDLRVQALWPYGRLPIAMTVFAGIEIFTVNYDLMVVNAIYGPEVAAEVRIGQQLRSLSSLPLQIYLMFSLDKLSRALRVNAEVDKRRREIRLVRLMLALCFAIALLVADDFAQFFFAEEIEHALIYATVAGILPLIVLGPRPDLAIASATENKYVGLVAAFLFFYVLGAPCLVYFLALSPAAYLVIQTFILSILFASMRGI